MNSFTAERNNYRRKLITLVKQHSILWNKKQSNYNKKLALKMEAWQDISVELNISVDKLRRTWENLRDQYRRDLKREMKYGFKSKWRFFNDMDFIRAMVACKESQNDYTDSESESEANDQKTQVLNQTQCSVITTNLSTNTTPTITTPANFANNEMPINAIPFQPILLTKQWQQLNEQQVPPPQAEILYVNQQNSNTLDMVTYAQPPRVAYEYSINPTDCDSARGDAQYLEQQQQQPPAPQAYEYIPKQEPDLVLETSNPPPAIHSPVLEKQYPSNNTLFSPAVHDEREFQEPSVSTSCQKRSRISQDSADTPTHQTATKEERNSECDFDMKDDDYYFVMSLLPSLRQIPRNRKFPLRLGIMNLIAKDLEEVVNDK